MLLILLGFQGLLVWLNPLSKGVESSLRRALSPSSAVYRQQRVPAAKTNGNSALIACVIHSDVAIPSAFSFDP